MGSKVSGPQKATRFAKDFKNAVTMDHLKDNTVRRVLIDFQRPAAVSNVWKVRTSHLQPQWSVLTDAEFKGISEASFIVKEGQFSAPRRRSTCSV